MLAAIVATQDMTQSLPSKCEPVVLALSAGSKCLPTSKVAPGGTQLFDSHAEVLCRRAFQLFLLKELDKTVAVAPGGGVESDRAGGGVAAGSEWLERTEAGKCRLKPCIRLHLYVSHTPCTSPHAEHTHKHTHTRPHAHTHTHN